MNEIWAHSRVLDYRSFQLLCRWQAAGPLVAGGLTTPTKFRSPYQNPDTLGRFSRLASRFSVKESLQVKVSIQPCSSSYIFMLPETPGLRTLHDAHGSGMFFGFQAGSSTSILRSQPSPQLPKTCLDKIGTKLCAFECWQVFFEKRWMKCCGCSMPIQPVRRGVGAIHQVHRDVGSMYCHVFGLR